MILPLLAVLLLPQQTIGTARATTLDTMLSVQSGTRLRVEATAGRIEVRTWERNSVQVIAAHATTVDVHISATDAVVNVWGSASGGRFDDVSYTITVPRWMGMTLGSGDVEIAVTGTQGEVIARNYSGKITVVGGRGIVSVKSTLGEVSVSGAEGRISAQSTHAPVHIVEARGDVNAESSSSHLYLSKIDSRNVSASTVGGVIWFNGRFYDDGHYTFIAHDGSVFLSVTDPVNATLAISTVQGGFSSAFPVERRAGMRRGQFTVKVGTGAASVEVQTFNGGIVLKKPDSTDRS